MFNPNPSSFQEQFLHHLSETVMWNSRSEPQSWCFWWRFHPQNRHQTNSDVAKQIRQSLNQGFQTRNMPATLAAVIGKVQETFAAEMAADGVNGQDLKRERGWSPKTPEDRYPWQVIYDWFWTCKFPREGWSWATKLAGCGVKELQMKPLNSSEFRRKLDLGDIPSRETSLEAKEPYYLEVTLPESGYLLLLNCSQDSSRENPMTRICLSPSQAFQPNPRCQAHQPLHIPDNEGLVSSLRFTEVGEEYFLAIVTETPLALSWVRPDGEPRDIEVDEQRLGEIFRELGKQWQGKLFYKRFQVQEG